jgi:hypothetical protein
VQKLLVVALVLAIAATANAGLTLSASSTNLTPNETAVVRIVADVIDNEYAGIYYLGVSGPGSLNIDNATTQFPGDIVFSWVSNTEIADLLGIQNPFITIDADFFLSPDDPVPLILDPKLADNIIFTCENWGDVTIKLFDGEANLVDSLTIEQTPEPATLALLGLGALLLRRKR